MSEDLLGPPDTTDEEAEEQDPSPQQVYDAAMNYLDEGISVVPIAPDGSKAPAWRLLPRIETPDRPDGKHSWKVLQHRLPTPEEVYEWYSAWGPTCGIAVVGGAISGGLGVIDFDSIDLFEPWFEKVQHDQAVLLDRLVYVETPRPGVHAYFRCVETVGNEKLARRQIVDPEAGTVEVKTLIETKGEGGYVIVPPSPSWCHPSRCRYRFLSPRDLTQVTMLSVSERDVLLEAARSLNEFVPPIPVRPAVTSVGDRQICGDRPGDDFNRDGDWYELLEQNGWTYVGVDASGTQTWRRPGKTTGISATLNYGGAGLLHVFSSNAHPLEADRSYTKFTFLAMVEFGGDFTAAAQWLLSQGYSQDDRLPFGRRSNGSQTLPEKANGSRPLM